MEELQKLIVQKLKEHDGVMKTAQLYEECGLTYRSLDSLLKEEFLVRVKNGYYSLKKDKRTEEERLAALFPDGVLCLSSALYYYGYLDQKPFAWDIAIDKNTSKSRFVLDYPVVIPYYTEPEVLKIGVQEAKIGSVTMKIYDRDRMICDVLKYEHKLDHEVLKAALRGYIADPKKDVHHLLEYARIRKVSAKVQNMLGVWL
ncbi:MAG: hypothetical protein ACI39H_09720 [Lachnospiraceae bacterium]